MDMYKMRNSTFQLFCDLVQKQWCFLRALFFISCALVSGCTANYPNNNQDLNPGVKIHGNQLPAVVLQAGLQDGKESWDGIYEKLARDNMVVAFDRPGHGPVPATKAPRDPCTIAKEQRELLRAAKIPPPYILVGHSIGGLYQYVFAKLYPGEVAGIVLLDPTHPQHWETMQKDAPAAAMMVKGVRLIGFNATDRAEFDGQVACLDSLDMGHPLQMPVSLLVSGQFKSNEQGDYKAMLQKLRQDWLRLLGVTEMEVVKDAGHYIHKDRPDAVISAIQSIRMARH